MTQPAELQDQIQDPEKIPGVSELARIPYARLWLIVACLVVYARFINNPVVFDDFNLFNHKEMLEALANSYFFDFGLRWFSNVTFGWTYKLVGTNVVWHRAINLALHASVVLALFAFLKRLFQATLVPLDDENSFAEYFAFWGALIFAIHPVTVYGVGYLIERSIVMATLFAILALYSFIRGLSGNGSKWHYMAAVWYFMAVFSKEQVVMLPLIMVSMIPLVKREMRPSLKAMVFPSIMFFGIALLIVLKRQDLLGKVYEPLAMTMLNENKEIGNFVNPTENLHLLSIALQGILFFKYLFLWLVPNVQWMSVDIQHNLPSHYLHWPETAGLVFYAIYPIAAGAFLWRGGKRGLLGFAMLAPWLFFPTEFFAVRIAETFTLYRCYLWMALLPAALPAILPYKNFRYRTAIFALVVVMLGLLSWNRLNTFTSNTKLWSDVISKLPDSDKSPAMYRAYLNRAAYRWKENGEKIEALDDLNKAIDINPKHPVAYNTRAAIKITLGRFLDGYEDVNRAIEIKPDFADAYFNRALAQFGLGNRDKAISDIYQAIELNPKDPKYAEALGKLKALSETGVVNYRLQ